MSNLSKRMGHTASRMIGEAREVKEMERMIQQATIEAEQYDQKEKYKSKPKGYGGAPEKKEVDWKDVAMRQSNVIANLKRRMDEMKGTRLANFSLPDIEKELNRRQEQAAKAQRRIDRAKAAWPRPRSK